MGKGEEHKEAMDDGNSPTLCAEEEASYAYRLAFRFPAFIVYPLISIRKPLLKKSDDVTKHSRIGCPRALPKINGLPLLF